MSGKGSTQSALNKAYNILEERPQKKRPPRTCKHLCDEDVQSWKLLQQLSDHNFPNRNTAS